MNSLRLAIQFGLGTLKSRPALTILAILLLSIGAAILGGVAGSVFLLRSLQNEFLSALSVELELTGNSEALRSTVMQRAEAWPSAEFVQYVPPEMSLREVERETGESLHELFTVNPFPPMVRVRFGKATLKTVDSLTTLASRWSEVAQAVYPKRLWADLERFEVQFQNSIETVSLIFASLLTILMGLCLRAQIRTRAPAEELLQLLGASNGMLRTARIMQCATVGIVGGLLASGLLCLLSQVYSRLLFRELSLPFWFYGATGLTSVGLALIAGLLFTGSRRNAI